MYNKENEERSWDHHRGKMSTLQTPNSIIHWKGPDMSNVYASGPTTNTNTRIGDVSTKLSLSDLIVSFVKSRDGPTDPCVKFV